MTTRHTAASAQIIPRTDLAISSPESARSLAISTFGQWQLHPQSWQRLCTWLAPLQSVSIVYTPTASADGCEGRLHWTLQQCLPFGSSWDSSGCNLSLLRTVLEGLTGITIEYRGLVVTPTGLALQGVPASEAEYARILAAREKLPTVFAAMRIPYAAPYVNTICHATVLRWTAQPTDEQLAYVRMGVERWAEAHIATLRPYLWTVGWMTLRCRPGDNTSLAEFHVPERIAHRGLLAGPDHSIENTCAQIDCVIAQPMRCECDLWVTSDGRLWLGHDAPITEISRGWILDRYQWLWIHAKTPATFRWLQAIRDEDGIPLTFFYHTDEDLVLLSDGRVIVYPGEAVLNGWISMMPERAPSVSVNTALGICSDYCHTVEY